MTLLLKAILGDDFELKDPDIPSENPLSDFLAKLEHQQIRKNLPGISDASWNDPLAPVEKVFTNPLGFDKSSEGYKLRIDRIEEETINGEVWLSAYAGSELVEVRLKR